MALIVDRIRDDVCALRKVVSWRGKHVIEIGFGDRDGSSAARRALLDDFGGGTIAAP